MKYVSSIKVERIKKFRRFEDVKRTLLADILVKYMICKLTKLKFEEISFQINKYGKPYIDELTDIHFNISHSGEWVVAAVSNLPLGIDIEKIESIDFKIAHKFFSKKEYEYLMGKNNSKRLECFYEFWTLKESYIKADGRGLLIPLNSFTLNLDSNQLETEQEFKECIFTQHEIDINYKMAICSTSKEEISSFDVFELKEFYDMLCSELIIN